MTPRIRGGGRPPCSASLAHRRPTGPASESASWRARRSPSWCGFLASRRPHLCGMAGRIGPPSPRPPARSTSSRCSITRGMAAPSPPPDGRIDCGWRAPSTRRTSAGIWKVHWNRLKTPLAACWGKAGVQHRRLPALAGSIGRGALLGPDCRATAWPSFWRISSSTTGTGSVLQRLSSARVAPFASTSKKSPARPNPDNKHNLET